jgi:hypothetical protein
MATKRIHFFIPDRRVAREIENWVPDEEPNRFASGAGHNLLELAVRVKGALPPGMVTWGPNLPPRSIVVVFAGDIWARALTNLWLATRLCFRPSCNFVLIRSDIPMTWLPIVDADLQFMPTKALAEVLPNAVWLPPLPQRGLIRRDPERGEALRVVGIKANPGNVPAACTGDAWESFLDELGIDWALDVPTETDGSDQAWHDFHNIDSVVILRPDHQGEARHKPATRLINAWRAGVIPLANDEPGVRELAHDGDDAFIVRDGADLRRVIRMLAQDAPLRNRVFTRSRLRGAEFDPTKLTAAWAEALASVVPDQRSRREALSRMAIGVTLQPRLGYWLARAIARRALSVLGCRH